MDGSDLNAVRREALALIARDEDALSDAEIFARQGDEEYWFVDLCLSQLNRLPCEIEPLLLCREYTVLQAHTIIKRAMEALSRTFADQKTGM